MYVRGVWHRWKRAYCAAAKSNLILFFFSFGFIKRYSGVEYEYTDLKTPYPKTFCIIPSANWETEIALASITTHHHHSQPRASLTRNYPQSHATSIVQGRNPSHPTSPQICMDVFDIRDNSITFDNQIPR